MSGAEGQPQPKPPARPVAVAERKAEPAIIRELRTQTEGGGGDKPPAEPPDGGGGDREKKEPNDPNSLALNFKLLTADTNPDTPAQIPKEGGKSLKDTADLFTKQWKDLRVEKYKKYVNEHGEINDAQFEKIKEGWRKATTERIISMFNTSSDSNALSKSFGMVGLEITLDQIKKTPDTAKTTINTFINSFYNKYYEVGKSIMDLGLELPHKDALALRDFLTGQLGGSYGFETFTAIIGAREFAERIKNSNEYISESKLANSKLKNGREKDVLAYLRGEKKDTGFVPGIPKPGEGVKVIEVKKKKGVIQSFKEGFRKGRQKKNDEKQEQEEPPQEAEFTVIEGGKKDDEEPYSESVKKITAVDPSARPKKDQPADKNEESAGTPLEIKNLTDKEILDFANGILKAKNITGEKTLQSLSMRPDKMLPIFLEYARLTGLFTNHRIRTEEIKAVTEIARVSVLKDAIRTMFYIDHNDSVRKHFELFRKKWEDSKYFIFPYLDPQDPNVIYGYADAPDGGGTLHINLGHIKERLLEAVDKWDDVETRKRVDVKHDRPQGMAA